MLHSIPIRLALPLTKAINDVTKRGYSIGISKSSNSVSPLLAPNAVSIVLAIFDQSVAAAFSLPNLLSFPRALRIHGRKLATTPLMNDTNSSNIVSTVSGLAADFLLRSPSKTWRKSMRNSKLFSISSMFSVLTTFLWLTPEKIF